MVIEINNIEQVVIGNFTLTIGGNEYRLRESVDGKLTINKSDSKDSALIVFPRYANEIEIL